MASSQNRSRKRIKKEVADGIVHVPPHGACPQVYSA